MASIPPWGLFRVLNALRKARTDLTVDLTLQGGLLRLGIKGGRPTSIASDLAPFSLSTYLAQNRVVPVTVLGAMEAKAREQGVPLCHILHEERALSSDQLARMNAGHVGSVIEALYPLAFQTFQVSSGHLCGAPCTCLGVDPIEVLMRAVARSNDLSTMREVVTRYLENRRPLSLAEGYEPFLTEAKKRFHEARILFLLRQGRTEEVRDAVISDERNLRILFALIVGEALGESRKQLASQPLPNGHEDPLVKEIRNAASDLRVKNHYEVLDLTLEARLSQVEEARRRLLRRWAKAKFEHLSQRRDVMALLEEIHARVEEAYEVLKDREKRLKYNRSLPAYTPDLDTKTLEIFEAYRAFQEGLKAFEAGRVDEALSRFEEAEGRDPEEPLYKTFIAKAILRKSPTREGAARARKVLQGLTEKGLELTDLHLVMATILKIEEKSEEAMQHVRTVLRYDPENVEAKRLKDLLNARSLPGKVTFQKRRESLFERLKKKIKGEE